ncbi:hypothetical protein [Peribacillus frigoritolerans]|uniref:hypothetical protein n=1 Tax=Peribacillus frigoritolerans TaxID=450367 RepID=UPI0023D9D86E|nr:hypothetical protein [Peribacillus frigoritolerans]MDF1998179.1 hypothetical protein [Peribacillus frigoritolerans]
MIFLLRLYGGRIWDFHPIVKRENPLTGCIFNRKREILGSVRTHMSHPADTATVTH